MTASLVPAHLCHRLTVFQHGKDRTVILIQPEAQRFVFAETLHFTPASPIQRLLQCGFTVGQDQPSGGRDGANQVMELGLDCRQIRKDIRVIKFQIIENHGAGAVVNKLAALVKEGGVVFIRFHHKKRRLPQSRRHPEIAGHTANQVTGIQARIFQDPGQHGTGGGFAMGAGHRQHPAPGKHHFFQQLRPGGIRQATIQHRFHRRIPPTQGITHHHQVRRRLQLGRIVSLGESDTGRLQLITHGRINILVTAGDVVPLGLGQLRQRPHEGAANTENMNMHGKGLPTFKFPAP